MDTIIEEKAKAYDEALERARALNNGEDVDVKAGTTTCEYIFPELKESEDEKIRKELIELISCLHDDDPRKKRCIAWLKKQKENMEKEYIFRPLAGTDITIAVEQAIRRADKGDRLVLVFNGAYIPVRKGCNANKIVDIYNAFIEKQCEASKAMETVEKIDKYIDEHLANAHDMKDSVPDKKYYRGWDDALGKMAGILQDVYSEEKQKDNKFAPRVLPCSAAWFEDGKEKQKEQRDYRKLYEDITQSEWFKKAYVGKGTDDESLISNVQIEEEFPKIIPDEKMKQIGEEISKAVVDYINEQFSKIVEKEQKPVRDIVPGDAIESCMLRYLQSAANRNDDIEIIEDTKAYKSELISLIEKEQKPAEVTINGESIPTKNQSVDIPLVEWSKEDETCLTNTLIMLKEYAIRHYSKDDVNKSVNWLENRVKSLCPRPKKEWSEEDKHIIGRLRSIVERYAFSDNALDVNGEFCEGDYAKLDDWLKSLQPQAKQEQKPVEWNEEDEDALNMCLDAIPKKWKTKSGILLTKWLKDNIHLQPKQEWDDEDKKILLSIIKAFRNGSVSTIGQEQWLKSLPERLNLQPQAKQGQKPLEYLTKKKINSIMSKLTNLSFSKLIPFNSEEYKKIDEITSDVCGLLDYPIEQKPAEWSEEDEDELQNAIDALEFLGKGGVYKSESGYDAALQAASWFKSLPKRFNLQPKPEWSEEDKETIDLTIAVLKENLPNVYFKTNPANTLNMGAISTDQLINRLKSLKNRGNFPKSNTNSPSEWSEEDEAMRDNILRLLSCFVGTSECDSNPSLSTSYPAYQKEIDWLKSLRPVSKESLQPHWKPSEEQLEALSETIAFAPDTFKPKCTLKTLQNDLKKLMEE